MAFAGTGLTILGLPGLAGSPVGDTLGNWPEYDAAEKVLWTATVLSVGVAGTLLWRWLLREGRSMKLRNNEALDAAYRAALYHADLPTGRVTLCVGERTQALDSLLTDTGHASWTFLTAHNPYSNRLTPTENAARHAELLEVIAATGLPQFPGEGAANPDGPDWPADWPAEISLLILGLPEADALALARRFGQNALLRGRPAGPAELVWTDPPGPATLPTGPPTNRPPK